MKIPEGEKVVILESGETGIIQYYDGSTAFVDVEGEIVQVHKNDIEKVSDFGGGGKKERGEEEKGEDSVTNSPYEEGIHLQFLAIKNFHGEIQRFDLMLLNNTDVDLLVEYHFYLSQEKENTLRKEINKYSNIKLNEFKTDQLNDTPWFDFAFWPRNVQPEFQFHFTKEIKLKAKIFFAKIESEEFRMKGYFTIELLKDIPFAKPKAVKIIPKKEKDDFFATKKAVSKENEVITKSELPDFIDLHAENLVPGYRNLESGEILRYQLNHCKNFLEKAIRYNLHKIYVVHGIGKGVLKQEVEKILKQYPEIDSYNNDYNPRFGFGATEIFLS